MGTNKMHPVINNPRPVLRFLTLEASQLGDASSSHGAFFATKVAPAGMNANGAKTIDNKTTIKAIHAMMVDVDALTGLLSPVNGMF